MQDIKSATVGYLPLTNDPRIEVQDKNEQPIIIQAIQERCIKPIDLVDENPRLRPAMKVTALLFSSIAKLPYLPIALLLRPGEVFAVAGSIAFLWLEYWAINDSLNDAFSERSQSEIRLIKNAEIGKPNLKKILLSSTILSLLSQVPLAIPSLIFNSGFNKWSGFTIIVMGGSLINIRSLQLLSTGIIQGFTSTRLTPEEKEMEKIRSKMIALINANKDIFVNMDPALKNLYIEAVNSSRDTNNNQYPEDAFLQHVFKDVTPKKKNCLEHLKDNFGTISGFVLSALYQKSLAEYTYDGSKQYITDGNEIGAGFISGAVVGSGIVITTYAIVSMTQRIWNNTVNLFSSVKKKTIAEQLRPKLTLSMQLIALAIDVIALGPSWVIWDDYYNKKASNFYQYTACATTFLFLLTGALGLIEQYIEELIKYKGKPEEKDVVNLVHQFKNLENIIKNCSLVDFSLFVSRLSPQLKRSLEEKIEQVQGSANQYRHMIADTQEKKNVE